MTRSNLLIGGACIALLVGAGYALWAGMSKDCAFARCVVLAKPAPPISVMRFPETVPEAAASPRPVVPKTVVARSSIPASFESAPDLWAYAHEALASSDTARVYEGYWATRSCMSMVLSWNDFATFVGGGTPGLNIPGPVTPARQLAVQNLGQKCAGFMKAGFASSKALAAELKARSKDLGAPEFVAEQKMTETNDLASAKVLMMSGSPWAMDSARGVLLDAWALGAGITDPKDRRRDIMLIAAIRGACDLGQDCSPNGFDATYFCALQGVCDGPLLLTMPSGLTPSEEQQVPQYQAQWVAAIKSRDLSRLGIR